MLVSGRVCQKMKHIPNPLPSPGNKKSQTQPCKCAVLSLQYVAFKFGMSYGFHQSNNIQHIHSEVKLYINNLFDPEFIHSNKTHRDLQKVRPMPLPQSPTFFTFLSSIFSFLFTFTLPLPFAVCVEAHKIGSWR